jgi:hypothetical protein
MPPLDKKLFVGENELRAEDLAQAEIANFSGDIGIGLTKFGWDGKKCCCIGLTLSPDNARVDRGVFLVRGNLEEKLNIEASRIWPGAKENVMLVMRFTDSGIFTFSEGDLGSDLVQQEAVEHGFYATTEGQNPTVILEADFEEYGIGDFSLRMTCQLSGKSSVKSGVSIKFAVLLFPSSKANLVDTYELAQTASWPGIRIMEGYLPLLPRPTTAWRCPVVPLMLCGTGFADGGGFPRPEPLRRAIGEIMKKSVVPETGRTGAALQTKWTRLAANPGELVVKTGSVTWPTTPEPEHETGM